MRISVILVFYLLMRERGGAKSCIIDLRRQAMERTINIHIEKLPEGVYLATSNDLQGLIAQGRTVAETIEIARDVARKLIEAQSNVNLSPLADKFDYPLILSVG
jgi:predicted RNase H-like HicB family nuclease